MKKIRADILVVQQGIAESRAKAQAMILAGQILTTDGVRIEKAGQLLAEDSPLYFKGARLKFVSRGGLKLEGALEGIRNGCARLGLPRRWCVNRRLYRLPPPARCCPRICN